MSARAARLWSLPFALLAAALSFAEWASGLPPHFVVFAIVHSIGLIVPAALYLFVTRRFRKPPAAWEPGFSVGPQPQRRAIFTIMLGWQAGFSLAQIGDSGDGGLDVSVLVLGVLGVVAAVVIAVNRRPSVTLDPEGYTVRGWFRSRHSGWYEPVALPRPFQIFIDPRFLEFTLDFYRLNPEHRAWIGTPEGAATLDDAYRSPRQVQDTVPR